MTYREACLARSLLDDDREQYRALQEATHHASGSNFRDLFCALLLNFPPSDPKDLFNTFLKHLSEDILYRRRLSNPSIRPDDPEVLNATLWELESRLRAQGKSCKNFHLWKCHLRPLTSRIRTPYARKSWRTTGQNSAIISTFISPS